MNRVSINVCTLCCEELDPEFTTCPNCDWESTRVIVDDFYDLFCRKCHQFVGKFYHETEYDPDGYDKTGVICHDCWGPE